MAQSIQEVLNRRTDLSTFVVHLTRDREESADTDTAAENLASIIRERRLRALTPMGWAKALDDPNDSSRQSQRVVAFSETPLEQVYSLFAEIEGRSINLRPYGLVLTKIIARMLGVNPVWYVDMTTRGGRDWEEARALDALRESAVEAGDFHTSPVAKVLPYFEWMGTWPSNKKEFWWEREWRHRGDLDLTQYQNRIIWLCPEAEHDAFSGLVRAAWPEELTRPPTFLDPSWGMEQVVARLCGLDREDVTLFHASAGSDEAPNLAAALHRALA
jgi:hypothetical protein